MANPGTGAPHIIVVGNEKGGTGKSTTATHLAVALMRCGHTVACIDLDAGQGTLRRFFENRAAYSERRRAPRALPRVVALHPSSAVDRDAAEAEDAAALRAALEGLRACDFVIIDTPGHDSALARTGVSHADTLITPLNDSFVDLDLLARIDPDSFAVLAPSRYAELVWEQKKARAMRDRRPIEWIVIRNRLSPLHSHNRRNMDRALGELARRIGFRTAPGFGERVVFRELFLKGLTLLDIRDDDAGVALTMSHVAALNELRALLGVLGLGENGLQPLESQGEERT